MFRMYFGLVMTGVAISNTTDALIQGYPWVAVFFAALGLIIGIPSWFDMRLLFKVEANLAEMGRDIDLLTTRSAEHASDAGAYFHALIRARDALSEGEFGEAFVIVSDALAHMEDNREIAVRHCVNWLTVILHDANKHWWIDPATGENLRKARFIVPTKLMLVVSELSEAMEAHRKNLPDDKLPHFDGFTVELADALIRILDLAGSQNCKLGDAAAEKMIYNAKREDHKVAARLGANGKAY